jgi:myo-inositol-1(or 4)-monophosphatase
MVDLNSILKLSFESARKAGMIIVSSEPSEVNLKSASDYVTSTDLKCQAVIKEMILKEFPEHTILAEEDGGAFEPSKNLWIIDPLDGTTNFIHGLKHSAVSIAFYTRGEIKTGVIYDPYADEMFHAVKGGGAFMNGKIISVSGITSLKASLIATGMPFRKPEKREKYFACLSEVLASSSGIRRMGSAAIDLAYVACGRFDGFFEGWLSTWDIAAGILLISEAGGKIDDFRGGGDFLRNGCVICSGPGIFDEFNRIVNKHLKDDR